MKLVKKTAEYTIFERNDKRYAIRTKGRKWINGEEKVKILQAEGLLKKPEPKPKQEVSAEASGDIAETSTDSE